MSSRGASPDKVLSGAVVKTTSRQRWLQLTWLLSKTLYALTALQCGKNQGKRILLEDYWQKYCLGNSMLFRKNGLKTYTWISWNKMKASLQPKISIQSSSWRGKLGEMPAARQRCMERKSARAWKQKPWLTWQGKAGGQPFYSKIQAYDLVSNRVPRYINFILEQRVLCTKQKGTRLVFNLYQLKALPEMTRTHNA